MRSRGRWPGCDHHAGGTGTSGSAGTGRSWEEVGRDLLPLFSLQRGTFPWSQRCILRQLSHSPSHMRLPINLPQHLQPLSLFLPFSPFSKERMTTRHHHTAPLSLLHLLRTTLLSGYPIHPFFAHMSFSCCFSSCWLHVRQWFV